MRHLPFRVTPSQKLRSALAFSTATALLALTGAPHFAHAGAKDFAVYTTRLGGDSESAQPYIDKFAAQLETALKWPKGSVKGSFLPSRKEALAYLTAKQPGFGVMEPALYFELRKEQKLESVVQIDSADLNAGKLHLVVKDPALKSLADLKGKRLMTGLADSPKYLGRVVLGLKDDPTTYFSLKGTGVATKGVRAVLRGEADATLLDDGQLEAAKKMEGGDALRTIYSSPALPPVVVVTLGPALSADERKKLAQALLTMCGTPDGAAVCKEMHIGKFTPVSTDLFKTAQTKFEQP